MNYAAEENISKRMAETVRLMEKALAGDICTEFIAPQGRSLTYEKLKAVYDYLKPEKLTIAGEEIEITGLNVHKAHCPEGFTVLTEKDNPNDVFPKRGKLVIIDENQNKAFIYDPPSVQCPKVTL